MVLSSFLVWLGDRRLRGCGDKALVLRKEVGKVEERNEASLPIWVEILMIAMGALVVVVFVNFLR